MITYARTETFAATWGSPKSREGQGDGAAIVLILPTVTCGTRGRAAGDQVQGLGGLTWRSHTRPYRELNDYVG
jgi:hypothetical protein